MDKHWFTVFFAVFAAIYFAEIPCMVRTAAIHTIRKDIWLIVTATILGNVAALLTGILLAKFCVNVPDKMLHIISAVALIGLGIYLLIGAEHKH